MCRAGGKRHKGENDLKNYSCRNMFKNTLKVPKMHIFMKGI